MEYIVQSFDPIAQKWIDLKSIDKQKSLSDAKNVSNKFIDKIKKFNKKAECDWRDRAYGCKSIDRMRIVEIDNDKKTFYPATKKDEELYSDFKEYYNK